MKKLFFLILFFSINILTFGANVYFLNGGPGYVYQNGQTFNSNQNGYAPVSYWIWADPARYSYNHCGARFQDPDGNWSDWSDLGSGSQGTHHCLKAGTWHVEGRVWVIYDITTGHRDFWMTTSFTLYLYVVDNYAPATPQNLSVSQSGSNHPLLSWSANTEDDMYQYKIYKKITRELGWQYLATTTSTSYNDVSESIPTYCPCHTVYYKITAVDINSNESSYSSTVNITVQGASPEKRGNTTIETPYEFSLEQNYPNPFNPATTINYFIVGDGLVILKVYDLLGKEVANLVNEQQEAGSHSVTFDGVNLPSGVYIYTLRVNNFIRNRKMTLMK